jgi:3-oxosteroid 1-dehydrogenase
MRNADVIVVGSGAAALTAAIVAADRGKSVVVLEQAPLVGGTSAFSGGMLWVPGSSHFQERGGADSSESAATYLRDLVKGRQYDDELIDVFIETAPRAVEYLEEKTPLRMAASTTYSDYYADHPGGTLGGRSIVPLPFDAREELGDWFEKLRSSPHLTTALTLDEMVGVGLSIMSSSGSTEDPAPDPRNVFGVKTPDLIALADERAEKGIVANGRALVGALLAAALERDVAVHTDTRAVELLVDDGVVAGVVASSPDGRSEFRAASVVLACGGFEGNRDLVLAFLGATNTITLSPPGNVGDGLRMGMTAGAGLANMTASWNYLVTFDPSCEFEGQPLATFGSTRFEAGSIAVNRHGRRFVNEAVAYCDVAKAFWRYDEGTQSYPNEPPAFLIFDQTVRDRAVVGDMRPGEPVPSWVTQADSLEELAAAMGIDPDGLRDEVAHFNEGAERGVDPDFKRGSVWFEGQTRGGPSAEATLAPIVTAPFYGMRVYHGLLGTAGGLRIGRDAGVLDSVGEPIPGLYACGNAAASIFGPMYPGGGTTLGLGVTFGYLAGMAVGG